MWVGVCRLEDIPTRGAYVVREIAGDSVIVVRTGDDSVRAFQSL